MHSRTADTKSSARALVTRFRAFVGRLTEAVVHPTRLRIAVTKRRAKGV